MRGVAVISVSTFHQSFRHRRVGVNGQRYVLDRCAHLHCQHRFGDQFTSTCAGDADADFEYAEHVQADEEEQEDEEDEEDKKE